MLFQVEIHLHGMYTADTVSLVCALEDTRVVGDDQPQVGSANIFSKPELALDGRGRGGPHEERRGPEACKAGELPRCRETGGRMLHLRSGQRVSDKAGERVAGTRRDVALHDDVLREAILVLPGIEEELRVRHAHSPAIVAHDVMLLLQTRDDAADETLAHVDRPRDLSLCHGFRRMHQQPPCDPRALRRERARWPSTLRELVGASVDDDPDAGRDDVRVAAKV